MITEDYKVGIYLRLSREDERLGESSSISTQRELLLNYIRDNNLIFVDEYVDDGVSGTTFDREGFNRMIKDCENKRINMIITKDTSRLGRDYIEFGFYVERYFPEHNIRYVAVNDGIDTGFDSTNNDIAPFKAILNDMYVKDISNKLRSSLNTKKRNGQFVGSYAPFGYVKDKEDKHKLLINEDEARVVRRIFNMFSSGCSLQKICDTLTKEKVPTPSISKNMNIGHNNYHYGVWATRTVSDMLQNPTYIGNLTQCRLKKVNYKSKKIVHNKKKDWIIAEDSVPKIIDEELFDLVQEMFRSNKNRGNHDGITSSLLLRGLIYCKECAHTIGFHAHEQITKKFGKVTRVYGNCNYWAKRKKQGVCTPHSLKYDDVEKIVLENLKNMCDKYLDENNLENLVKNSDKLNKKKEKIKYELLRLDKAIEKNKKKIDACYNDKLDGTITLDMYKRIYNDLTLEIKKFEEEKNTNYKLLEDINNNKLSYDNHYLEIIKEFKSMKNPSRALITNLIDRIDIDENHNIDIYYKFKLV